MNSSLLHGGRNELERLFDEVADSFKRLDITAEVLMVGGSWMLWFGLRDSTRDVDSARRLPAAAAAAIADVAGRHDLDSDWLNDSATPFLPFGFDAASCTMVYAGANLTVSTPPPETIFLMKLQRASAPDREDMLALWPLCTFIGAADVVARFESAYPYAPKDEHLGSFVEDIIADAANPGP
jgi:hypothetical protein